MAEVLISSGITTAEAAFGDQRKVAYVGNAYYVFYLNGGDVWYKKSTTSDGSAFGSAVQVNTTSNTVYQPAIYVDGTDIHIVYFDTAADAFFYRKLDTTDDSLTTETQSADLGAWSSASSCHIAVDSGGRVYAFNSTEGDIYYTDNGGTSWTSINNANINAHLYNSMVCVGTDLIFIQYDSGLTQTEEMIYNGSSWSGPTAIDESYFFTNPWINTSVYGGVPYLFTIDYDGTHHLEVWKKSGGTWTEQGSFAVDSTIQNRNYGLTIATNNGKIYASYVIDNGSGQDTPYYRVSEDDGVTWSDAVEMGFTIDNNERIFLSAVQSNGSRLGAIVNDTTASELLFVDVLPFIETRANSSKANILVSNNTKPSSVKGSVQRPKIATFIDNFNDNSLDSSLWGTTSFVEQNERLEASLVAGGAQEVDVSSDHTYDTENSEAFLEYYHDGSGQDGQSMKFQLQDTVGDNNIFWLLSNTNLRAYVTENTTETLIASTTYDPDDHRWLKIRNDGTNYYWETSPDGINWTTFTSRSDSAVGNKDAMDVYLWVINEVSGTKNVYFDNFNYEPQINYVTANIIDLHEEANSAKASIVRTESYSQSSKGSILVPKTASQNTKANLYDIYRAYSKANITAPVTAGQSAKANIPAPDASQSVKGYIKHIPAQKTFEYRIYDNNVYQTTWATEVISEPSFRTIINGGSSEMVVRLAREFDNFGEDDDVKLNNMVDVWCFDKEAPNGQRIYRGYISGYRPIFEGNNEFVEITILSYLAETSGILVRSSAGNTQYEQNSLDPSTIMQNVINRYRAYGGTIQYTEDSIDLTGTSVSYTFETDTTRDALDKIIELSPEGWYWYLDSDAVIQLHAKPEDATHVFRVGREVAAMETWRRGEDIVNEVFFIGGGSPQMFRYYKNDGSIDAYGRRSVKKIDQRVTITATADTIANRIINSKKDPEIRTRITINDSNNNPRGYDIESIKVGDTFQIGNLKQGVKTVTLWDIAQWDEDVWDQTLAYSAVSPVQILSVDYRPDQVVLEASSRIPEITKRIEDINRNAETSVLINNPSSPTDA